MPRADRGTLDARRDLGVARGGNHEDLRAVLADQIPRPSFASHDFFSITYSSQRALLDKFLAGEIPAQDLVSQYGAQIFVVPACEPRPNPGERRAYHDRPVARLYVS